MLLLWLQFLGLVLIICVSGYFLSVFGDQISDLSGLGKSWIGVTLMAMVTSLPELGSGVSSVALANAPDLAAGNIFGSCTFNILILCMADAWYRKKTIFQCADQSHLVTALIGSFLIGLACLALLINTQNIGVRIGHVGLSSIVIFVSYVLMMKIMFKHQTPEEPEIQPDGYKKQLNQAIMKFSFFAFFVIGSGLYLPILGEKIVTTMGWNQAFFGTLFLAFATSLPEMVVTFGALSIGSVDLAIGNVLGSNLFNVATFFVNDLAYTKDILFVHTQGVHVITGLIAILMGLSVMLGFVIKPQKNFLRLSIPSVIIIAGYVLSMIVVFRIG